MGDRSVDARDISRSVVVTGDGNNVALNFGEPASRCHCAANNSRRPIVTAGRARASRRANSTFSSPRPVSCR